MPQVTAAAHPVVIGGVTYMFAPLTDRDSDEIDNWLRGEYIRGARASLDENTPAQEREEILRIAIRDASRLSYMTGEGARMIASFRGIFRVIWQGLRREQPNLSFDEFRDRMSKLKEKDEQSLSDDVDATLAVFKELNVGIEPVKKKSPTQATNQTRQQKRRCRK